MEANTTYPGNSERLDENLTKFMEEDKNKLSKLILARISVIKQFKRNLTFVTKTLIEDVEAKCKSILESMDEMIDSMIKILNKDKYNTDELFTINNIFTIKLVLPLLEIESATLWINEKYDKMIFDWVPINNDHYDKKINDFNKYNSKEISLILRSQDKSFYVTGGKDGVIRIWDEKGYMKNAFYNKQKEITALTLSADGNYVVSGSIDEKINIIDLKSLDSTFRNYNKIPFHRNIYPINSVSISSKNQYVIYSIRGHLIIIDIMSNIYTRLIGHDWIITQIGNIDNILAYDLEYIHLYKLKFLPKNIISMKIILPHEDVNRMIDYARPKEKLLGLSKSGKYVVYLCNYEYDPKVYSENESYSDHENSYSNYVKSENFFIMKLNIPVNGQFVNKHKEVVGVNIEKSKFYNKLIIEKQMKYEASYISEDLEYIVLLSSETAYIWSTSNNEIISQKHIGKNQSIVGVSHSFMFIGNLNNELICSNLKTNEIKIINFIDNFINIKRVSITKDLKKLLIHDNMIINVIETDSSIMICTINRDNFCDFYVTNHYLIFVSSGKKIELCDLETGDCIEMIDFGLNRCLRKTPLGSADGRYICFVLDIREYDSDNIYFDTSVYGFNDEKDSIEKYFQYILIDIEDIYNYLFIDFLNKNIQDNSMILLLKSVIPLIFNRYQDDKPMIIEFSDLFNVRTNFESENL